MSLREAAGRFRLLDKADPGHPPGLSRPSADEWVLHERVLGYVWMVLREKGQFTAAVRWYDEAFTAHPRLLDGPPTGHRYQAACAAVLAGCGQARDAADLDDKGRAGFRWQALAWLRSELEALCRLQAKEPEQTRSIVVHDLKHWLEDPAFAGVRGPDARAQLPEDEHRAWQRLWKEVADTRARAEGTTPPE
jgi:hypothetical protein